MVLNDQTLALRMRGIPVRYLSPPGTMEKTGGLPWIWRPLHFRNWRAWQDSNLRPQNQEIGALSGWATGAPTPGAHRPLPRAPPRQPVEGTPRRARGPPMDYGDKLLTQPSRYTFAPPHGRFLLRR